MDLRVILVPYDSSHYSENALEYAVYLAKAIFSGDPKKRTIKILMLHIVQEIPFTTTLLGKMKINRKNENPSLNEHANSIYQETKTLMQKDMDKKRRPTNLYTELNSIHVFFTAIPLIKL